MGEWCVKVLWNLGLVFKEVEGSCGKYLVELDLETGVGICTCPGFVFHKKDCKHIRQLRYEVEKMGIKRGLRKKQKKDVRYFQSSISGINRMFVGGAYSSKIATGVFGLPGIGKSLFCIQECYYLLKQGYRVLFVDTEGSLNAQLDNWEAIFMERFGISDEVVDENLIMEDRYRKLDKILEYFGYRAEIKLKGGKVEVDCDEIRDKRKKWPSEFEKDIVENNVDFVIFDSLTNPIRLAIPPNPQNTPTKSYLEGKIIEKLCEVQDKYNVGCLVTMQGTFNPSKPYDNAVHFRGGLSVRYNVKRVLGFLKREKKDLEDYRQVWFVRGETGKPYSQVTFVKYTDLGILDVDLEKEGLKLEDMLTKSQLEMYMSGGVDGEFLGCNEE
jgi:archaellum biogenesis ATPase FlaH